jgi:hypothetical protein
VDVLGRVLPADPLPARARQPILGHGRGTSREQFPARSGRNRL